MVENPNLEGAMERIRIVQAKREAVAAERKARWDQYYEQLSKSTPHQGGAHTKKSRVFHLWSFHE